MWIPQYMLESIREVSSSASYLSYGLRMSHILDVLKVDVAPFSPKIISSTYDKMAFAMMGYTLVEDGWVKCVNTVDTLVQTERPTYPTET